MNFPLDGQLDNRQRQSGRRVASRAYSKRAGDASSIGRATLISMIGMLLAKGTGFLRELLIVPKLNYGLFSDAYINAFQIPDLIYELLVGGAVAAVLTPTLAAGIERNQEKKAWRGVSIFMSVAIVATAVLLLLAELLAPVLVGLITGANGANASAELKEMATIATPLTRILLLQTFLMMLVALTHGVLSAYKRFTPIAFGPSLYNVFYVLALILFGSATMEGVSKVSWGVVLAAFIYFIYQFFAARRELLFFSFSLQIDDPDFRRLLNLAIPTLLSGSVLHLNAIVMNRFANGLDSAGAVTSIRQCTTTWGLPYAIFAVSIGIVMLPNLSGLLAAREHNKVRSLYTNSLRHALFMVAPFALSFAIMNKETIQAIFQWNSQSYTDLQVAETGMILRWFCISMFAQTVVFLTNQAFYARKVTKLALFTGVLTLMFNPIFCAIFVHYFHFGAEGIGMAHALYSVLTALIVFYFYRRHKPSLRPYKLIPFFLRLFLCALPTVLVLIALNQLPLYFSNKVLQLLIYGVKLVLALFTFYLTGIAINFREAVRLQNRVRALVKLPPVSR